ncbi:MAG: cytochrome c peroxidase [Bacteroidia bacterium]
MSNRKKIFLSFSLLAIILLAGFTINYADFTITQKDVEIKIPKGFPKPIYNLEKNKLTPAGFTLGRKLFYDPILSKDNTISCASCHQQFAAFSQIDHALSHGVNGLIGKRNAPPLQNLIWKDAFMWDGGINHLDLQPISPITNPLEMNESLDGVLKKLQQNKEYVGLFKSVYNDSIISSDKLLKSLSQFLVLLISADSRYDRYTHGKDTLSKAEKRGLKLFRANCATCHKEPLFTDNSYRNNGLSIDANLKDSARYKITGYKVDLLKFKVPSLRNIAVTYPYMHDGRFYNLQQVLNHYTKKFVSTDLLDPVLQKGITMTDQDKKDVIAFLKTLTDRKFLTDVRFHNPNIKPYKPIVKKAEPIILTEDELVTNYKLVWDSTRVKTINSIPQYNTHIDDLDAVLQQISQHAKSKHFLKLETLRLEFMQSTKHKVAIKNYILYGQPTNAKEIINPCVQQLNKVGVTDITNTQLKKQTKKGWLVSITYKEKDKLKTSNFNVVYNPITKNYLILKR